MRLFNEHFKRRVNSLDGAWSFSTDPNGVGVDENWYDGLPRSTTVTVPSVWNTTLGLLEYEGACWYERDFYTEGGILKFVFGAVMTLADVWLDGEKLGSHYGGFCRFDLIARNVSAGKHKLTVRVDNSFDEHSIPQAVVDWYHYGGITRSVSVETLVGVSILEKRLEYELNDALDKAYARFVLDLYNASSERCTDTVFAEVAGKCTSLEVTLEAGETLTLSTEQLEIEAPRLWSTREPNLYETRVITATDDLFGRVGFRRICVENGSILLNGEKIKLLGVNRHEEHPDHGSAFPHDLMRRDIELARNMGCNTLRGSHYPNDPMFVDMLDECGILFWSEIPIWGGGFNEKKLADSVVLDRGEAMHREMVRCYYDHPSIIIWGMHNEILTNTPVGKNMAKRYYPLLKEIGGNRIVTYATDKALDDICFEYCDIICINRYNGWYVDDIASWNRFVEDLRAYRSSLGFENKPVVISEFGAAAVYGHRSFETYRWSEEYQAELLEHCIKLFLNDPMIVGTYIWQFCDIRTSREVGLTRARGYNNKGVLNEYRNPKAAYFAVKELYTKAALREKYGENF